MMIRNVFITLIFAGVGVFSFANQAQAAQCGDTTGTGGTRVACSCGDTVTTSVTLAADDPVVTNTCTGHGLVVGANGITIDGGNHTITGDSGTSDYGINNSGGWDNIVIQYLNITHFGRGINLSSCTGSTIQHNTVNSNQFGIRLASTSNSNTFTGNTANSNTNSGFYFAASSSNTLTGNTANSNNSYGIYLSSSSNNNNLGIDNTPGSGNTANQNGTGIIISASTGNHLNYNTTNSNTSYGIKISSSSSSNILTGNTANSNRYNGIYLYASSSNTLTGNTANSNNSYGISLESSSSSNTLTGNIIKFNQQGIGLDSSSTNNNLGLSGTPDSGNIVYSNTYGIYLASSSNTLTNNIIFSNGYDLHNTGLTNTYSSNLFNHNIASKMFTYVDVEPIKTSRIYSVGDTISFDISMLNVDGTACSDCSYTITSSPSETITSSKNSNEVTGSFKANKSGTYSLTFTITDAGASPNITKRNLRYFVGGTNSKLTTYYLRKIWGTHGQPMGNGLDIQSLLFTAPTSTEIQSCSTWTQNSPDELPDYPLSNLSDVDIHSWYILTDEPVGGDWIGIERNAVDNDTIDYSSSVLPAADYTENNKSFDLSAFGADWAMDYLGSWYRVDVKLRGADVYWTTFPSGHTADEASYARFTYSYTTTPAIKSISNDNINVLSATAPADDASGATLVVDGTVDHLLSGGGTGTIVLGDSTHHFKRPFTGNHVVKTTIRSDGSGVLLFTGITGTAAIVAVPLDITPNTGSIDVAINTWNTSGSYYKEWTETGSVHDLSSVHKVGNLEPNAYYTVEVDDVRGEGITGADCDGGRCLADTNGVITFTYAGGYSEKTFEVSQADTTPPTGASITSVTATSTTELSVVSSSAADADPGLHVTPYQFQRTGADASAWQAGTTFTVTGLSPNTRYGYAVRARDEFGNTSTYSTTSSGYTLAPTPTDFREERATTTSATISVDSIPNSASGSSGYFFSRTGGGTSGWITMNTWTATDLSCGSTYTYTVKYRNGDGIETPPVSLTAQTSRCDNITSSGEGGGTRGRSATSSSVSSVPSAPSTFSVTSASSSPTLQQPVASRLAARKAKRQMLAVQVPAVPSYSPSTYRVKVPLLNLRADSRTSAFIRDVLKRGTLLPVIRFVQNDVWAQVRLQDGRTGFVYAPSLEKVKQ